MNAINTACESCAGRGERDDGARCWQCKGTGQAVNANTKHTCGGPAFGRLTEGCPRCEELKNGAPARRLAWRPVDREARRAAFGRDLAEALRKARETGEVCTFGEW